MGYRFEVEKKPKTQKHVCLRSRPDRNPRMALYGRGIASRRSSTEGHPKIPESNHDASPLNRTPMTPKTSQAGSQLLSNPFHSRLPVVSKNPFAPVVAKSSNPFAPASIAGRSIDLSNVPLIDARLQSLRISYPSLCNLDLRSSMNGKLDLLASLLLELKDQATRLRQLRLSHNSINQSCVLALAALLQV